MFKLIKLDNVDDAVTELKKIEKIELEEMIKTTQGDMWLFYRLFF